jgi:hypothetical protein
LAALSRLQVGMQLVGMQLMMALLGMVEVQEVWREVCTRGA